MSYNLLMKMFMLCALTVCELSCQTIRHDKVIECGIGVKNDGVIDTCAMEVLVGKKAFSFGGVTPGNSKTTIDGCFLGTDENYSPIMIEYGLRDNVYSLKNYPISWVRPPNEVLGGSFPPTMMIYIYPGIEGKKPHIVWEK